MKHLLSLAFFSCVAISAVNAQGAGRSMLRLRLSDRSPISVNLDGRYINEETTALTMDGIRPGAHRLEVYSTGGYSSRPIRIYTGTLELQAGTINTGVIDVYRRGLRLRTQPMDNRDEIPGDDRGNNDRPYNDEAGNNDGPSRNDRGSGSDEYGDHSMPRAEDQASGDSRKGYGSFPHGRGGTEQAAGSGAGDLSGGPLTKRDMDDMRTRVSARITDTDKEQLMKSALQTRTVSTAQAREMMGWLSFDNTKLDFAKWAYAHAADRKNYWKLEDAFSFDASKKEFEKAIGGSR